MKFVIRRALVSVIAAPVIASLYVFGYGTLIFLGATPTSSFSDCWVTGWIISVVAGLWFTLAEGEGRII